MLLSRPRLIVLGITTIAIVLELTRRTVGPIPAGDGARVPRVCLAGAGFDCIGLSLVARAHRGYGADRLVGALYMSLEGMFGVPLDERDLHHPVHH